MLETRVVVPLFTSADFRSRAQNLNPALEISGRSLIMDTASIGVVPIGELRRPVANLVDFQFAIQDALDTLFGPN